jgi:hypothetical protein
MHCLARCYRVAEAVIELGGWSPVNAGLKIVTDLLRQKCIHVIEREVFLSKMEFYLPMNNTMWSSDMHLSKFTKLNIQCVYQNNTQSLQTRNI